MLETVLQKYENLLRNRGLKGSTIQTTMYRLRTWHEPDVAVSSVTASMLERKYLRRQEQVSVDTQRNELSEVKTFWRWVVKKSLARKSPAENIEPVGRRKRGKLQLRKSEARRFYEVALDLAQKGDEGALAGLLVLMLGIRRGELLERRVRDIDVNPDGVWLWIDEGKTEAAARYHDVPKPIAGMLAERVSGRESGDWLFPSELSDSGHTEQCWLRSAVRRVCKAAGVPEVTPHGLRGTHSTLAREEGATGRAVSQALGHASEHVTEQHYLAPGTVERVRARRVFEVIQGGKSG
jgi:integrase